MSAKSRAPQRTGAAAGLALPRRSCLVVAFAFAVCLWGVLLLTHNLGLFSPKQSTPPLRQQSDPIRGGSPSSGQQYEDDEQRKNTNAGEKGGAAAASASPSSPPLALPRPLIPLPPAPEPDVPDTTTISCIGDTPLRRVCSLRNVCIDRTADIGRGNSRFDQVVLYAGAGKCADGAAPCIPIGGSQSNELLASRKHLASSGSLNHGNFVMRPRVEAGAVPDGQVLEWRDEPLLLISRHYTSNFAHAVSDDIFPLFKLARDRLQWDPVDARARMEQPGAKRWITAGWLDYNTLGTAPWLVELYRILLPGIQVGDAQLLPLRDGKFVRPDSAKPLQCFRGPVLVGVGDESMMRNAHYAFHMQWTFGNAGKDWARALVDWRQFIGEYRAVYELPPLDSVPGTAGVGDTARSVLIINRRKNTGGSDLRTLSNIDEILARVRAVAGERSVTVRDWLEFSDADNTVATDNADLVISIHGAGNMMMMAARPGTVWLELMPPRASPVLGIYLAMAQRQRLRYAMQTVFEAKCDPKEHFHMQKSFKADADAVAAHAAWLLGSSSAGDAQGRNVQAALDALPASDRRPDLVAAVIAGAGPARSAPRVEFAEGGDGPADSAPDVPRVIVLLPSRGPRRVPAGSYILGALTDVLATETRAHMGIDINPRPGVQAKGQPGSVVGTRIIRIVDPSTTTPSSMVELVGAADLVLAPHGTGSAALMAGVRPGTVWIDLVPPRSPAAHTEYLPLARASGVRLHHVMLKERDCNSLEGERGYDQPEFDIDLLPLASVVALLLRTEV